MHLFSARVAWLELQFLVLKMKIVNDLKNI